MDVKRVLGLALLLMTALVTWMASQLYFAEQDPEDSPYWWRGLNFTGQIVRLDSRELVIHPKGEQDLDFKLADNTRVMLVGHVTLKTGLWVQVKYLENTAHTEKTALGIREVKPPGGSAARPQSAASAAAQ